ASVEVLVDGALPTAGVVVAVLQSAVELALSSRSSIRRLRLALCSTRSAPAPRLETIRKRVAAFNNVLDLWEFVTRHDKETVCRPVDLSELVKRNLDPHRA